MPYDPAAIEAKWQAWWRANEVFRSELDPSKPKFYVLDMFPYPSGAGLHVGHPKGYIATDIVSRYKRMRGFSVLHPMGWDAFGLPAEQYAIETGTHPRDTTAKNIATFKRQLQSLGLDYDWSREIDTTDPRYVKWTQWIFRRLYERDLAYLAEVPVNWCPALGTVLANEEVIDGKSERGGHPVVRVPMRPVDAAHHRLRRSPRRGPRRRRLARVDQEDAARLGRAIGGRADLVRRRGLRRRRSRCSRRGPTRCSAPPISCSRPSTRWSRRSPRRRSAARSTRTSSRRRADPSARGSPTRRRPASRPARTRATR
jgi:hypothetical protein